MWAFAQAMCKAYTVSYRRALHSCELGGRRDPGTDDLGRWRKTTYPRLSNAQAHEGCTQAWVPRAAEGHLGAEALPLGDLARLLKVRVQIEDLIVQQPPERHICQLLHHLKHLIQVQKRGEVTLLILRGDPDGVREKDIGRPLQLQDVHPRDDEFNWTREGQT